MEIHRAVTRLYDALGLQRARLRLVGVRVEGLVPRTTVHRQLVLGEPDRGWSDADRAVDRATRRFGSSAVRPASQVPINPPTPSVTSVMKPCADARIASLAFLST